MASQLLVKYLGTNVGKIYLSDIGKRYGLGGDREGDYKNSSGQDKYIVWGESKVLQESGEVLMSYATGVLKFFSTEASSTVFTTNGAPLTIVEGPYTLANEVPRSDIGSTGTGRYSDTYMAILANPLYGPTGLAGATGTYVGQTF